MIEQLALMDAVGKPFDQIARVMNLPLDWRVLTFATLLTATSVVLFGLAPALRAMRVPPIDALQGVPGSRHGLHRGGRLGYV